jgi:ABC-2 type transport system ATP-binding protein
LSVIEVRDLCKEFTTYERGRGLAGSLRSLFTRKQITKKAVDHASFTVDRGEMVGYVGPNGAGKSTTIKLLTGILYPTSGAVSVCGLIPSKDRRRNLMHIGTVFGQRTQLWWDLPLIESFELLKFIYKVPAAAYKENMERFRDILDLDEFMRTPVRQLSLGQRMRGDIAASLLHNPDLLYLDEPTIGLDVVAKERIRRFIADLNREKKTTVILTTHDLTDIGTLCDRIIIIDTGRIIYDGRVEEIRRRFGSESSLLVVFKEPPRAVTLQGVEEMVVDGMRARIRFDRKRIAASDLIGALLSKCAVSDLTIEDTSLEKIIREIYMEKTHDARLP